MKKKSLFLVVITILNLFILISCKKNPLPVAIPILPTITSISPISGISNTSVTITGKNFDAIAINNTVKFNGVVASVNSATTTTLMVTAPAVGSTGAVSVTTTGGTATGPVFTYLNPPTITAINPTSGISGTVVTITGTNFDAIAANNTVKFNGTIAAISSASTTSLTVTAPAGGTTGTITVTTTAGMATGTVFTYLILPTITSINPTSGTVGISVTISGTNFDPVVGNNTVKFNGVSATVTSATITSLVVTTPFGGSTGTVTVTTSGGTATGPTFTYVASADVYVLGRTSSGFCYWKNGVRTDLPADAQQLNSTVNSIFVSGTDVYVAGSAGVYPAYWKNGSSVLLPSYARSASVYSIYVSGTDVYTCASAYEPSVASYYIMSWKNAVANFPLNNSGTTPAIGNVFGITMSGSDVYIAGNQMANLSSNRDATYWKNSVPVVITTGGSSSANGIYVLGSDVYLAGNDNGTAKYWKNGVATLLSPALSNGGISPGRVVYVSGSDVYIVGQSNGAAKYWKNGTMVGLTTVDNNGGIATCIHGTGSDVYIGGISDSANTINTCGYWKNGVLVTIPGCTYVYDIFVK